ncbi:MAG: hypothetical protein ITG02_12695 [Patulibacter sp.]|nr:hypothetical protein [Patulibacter sp.]
MTDDAYCPHCTNLLRRDAPHPYPSRAMRCPACLILVGAGRSATETGERRIAPGVVSTRGAGARRASSVSARTGPPVDLVRAVLHEVHDHHVLR